MKTRILPLIIIVALTLNSCKKDKSEVEIEDNATTRTEILKHISENVIAATYSDMASKSALFLEHSIQFRSTQTEANLALLRSDWKSVRSAWEQSEGFLFGPVATDNIDPRIDTWPVNHVELDSILAQEIDYTESYVDGLQDALKGFHPMEYLVYGVNSNKAATAFPADELDFLVALATNLNSLCQHVASEWTSASSGYRLQFNTAGNSNSAYTTHLAAFEELVNAMSGICDEVANGKIAEPYTQLNASLEESPFSKNSLSDFKNNIQGVKNIYKGTYLVDGKGVEDFVRVYNLSLDAKLKQQMDDAIASLTAITDPFGQAIFTQATLVQKSIDKINVLKSTLENELLPLVQQKMM